MKFIFIFLLLFIQYEGLHFADESDYLISLGGLDEIGSNIQSFANPSVEISHFGTVHGKICRIDELPERVSHHSAVHTSYGPIFCGGIPYTYYTGQTQDYSTKCYRLLRNGTWIFFPPLNYGRASFSMNEVNKRLISIGGWSSQPDTATKSLDYIDFEKEKNWKSINLPFAIYDHCSLKFDNQTILITGGNLNWKHSRNTTFLNVSSWTFTPGPPLNKTRTGHGCASSFYDGSYHFYVVGGGGASEDNYEYWGSIEEFNLNTNKWSLLSAKLPSPLYYPQVVHANSPKYHIYVVGGWAVGHDPVPTIYGLKNKMEWTLVGNLSTKRINHVTINIPRKDISDM